MILSDGKLTPADRCRNLDEVRAGMDSIDRQIIHLIAERVAHVRAAAKFKTSAAAVADPDRIKAVLDTRREWAQAAGLEGEPIEALYRDLVAYCIREEAKYWHANATVR